MSANSCRAGTAKEVRRARFRRCGKRVRRSHRAPARGWRRRLRRGGGRAASCSRAPSAGRSARAAPAASRRRAPVVFAANRLVVAVPADGATVRSLGDLGNAGVRIAAGSASVPVGSYTREVLARLGAEAGAAHRAQHPLQRARRLGRRRQGLAGRRRRRLRLHRRTCRPPAGACAAIELPARLQPHVRLRRGGREGHRPPRARRESFVDGPARAATAQQALAARGLRAAAMTLTHAPHALHGAARGRHRAHALLPHPARRRDLRRRRAARADLRASTTRSRSTRWC